MSPIIKADLRLLLRQDFKDATLALVQEVYRDPHGNVVRFSVLRHAEIKNQASDFAVAENLVDGLWHVLVKMFHGNLPADTGAAMTWLMSSTGAVLGWPEFEGHLMYLSDLEDE
jgi:hypothetical protein